MISGIPTAAGTFTITDTAKNAGGFGTNTLTITINPAKPVVSSGTAYFLATRIRTNVRRLEGALIRVASYASLTGKKLSIEVIEGLLRDLSLLDKRDEKIMTLSGGMKRRVMIAKALSHEPQILFLDEPTAGVDVELRRDMWNLVRGLREKGVTIILTTHYIEEAEEMADRIGVINKGTLMLVEDKKELMKKLGKRQLTLHLQSPLQSIPAELQSWALELKAEGNDLVYTVDSADSVDISTLLKRLSELSIVIKDLQTHQSSLEDIFVNLVTERA